ncbi:MAG: hypothetical protein ACI4MI_05005 [Christensenellales bacterium]
MRNRKVCLLLAMVLVVAMVCGLVMGCTPDSEGPEVQGPTLGTDGGSSTGSVQVLGSADKFITFDILSTANPESLVTVRNKVTNTSVAVAISAVGQGIYRVYPPNGGYEMGDTYVIELGKGVTFANYQGKTAVEFTINTNVVANIKLSGGVKEFPSNIVTVKDTEKTDDQGNVIGSMTLQTNGTMLEEGEVFIITDVDTNAKEAFKITKIMSAGEANVVINYTKPDIDEVYEEFTYAGQEALNSESNVELYDSSAQYEVLENSEFALMLASFFGEKPKFNVSVNKVDDKIAATVSITIPGVVELENGTKTDLVLSVENLLSAVADTSMFKMDNELEFDVSALITNEITCKASIATHASFDEIVNVRQLIDKLTEVAEESAGDDAVSVPLFKWILPIANGAAQISYQADLAFRFAFAGSFDVIAKTTLQYNVGASYSKADGINTYAEEVKKDNDQVFESVSIKLQGNATIKVGIIQEIRFDVLSGVLGLGIQAELGNYNRLYGYFQTDNLLDENAGAVGNLYFAGGFYYDVDLKFGIKIGSLINLVDQKVDITAGEIQLYDIGERELILSINEKKSVELNAFTNVMPTYTMQVYDMVTGKITTQDIPTDLIKYEVVNNASAVTIDKDANTISVNERNVKFSNVQIQVSVDGAQATPITTTFTYTGAVVLNESNYSYDKSAENAQVVITANIGGEVIGTPVAKVGETVIANSVSQGNGVYTLTLDTTELDKLSNGTNFVQIVAGEYSTTAKVEISGNVSVFANQDSVDKNIYYIYTADQINDMIARNVNFAGKTFVLKNDINMNGAELGQISKFAGTLNGGGYKIYNYTINTLNDNVAAFIAENVGTITDITFAGKVEVEFKATTNTDYVIAGVVGVNNGRMTNVKLAGDVIVKSTGLQAFVNVDVAGIAGTAGVNATMDGCDVVSGTMSITYTFDLANVTFNAGAITTELADSDMSIESKCTVGKSYFTTVNVAK